MPECLSKTAKAFVTEANIHGYGQADVIGSINDCK